MSTTDPIQLLVLEEFRLHAADLGGAAARIVAASKHGIEPSIPLLTSIEDRRAVATVRALHAGERTESDALQHAALDPLVWSWAAPRHYVPRIAEHAQTLSSSFRLAVTESGINGDAAPPVTLGRASGGDATTSRSISLLWIGAPVGTHAGLLLLLGSHDDRRPIQGEARGWPLPLSRELGVRIYESDRA